jgi:hypothetical protein
VTWQLKPEEWDEWMRPLQGVAGKHVSAATKKRYPGYSYTSNSRGIVGKDVIYAVRAEVI